MLISLVQKITHQTAKGSARENNIPLTHSGIKSLINQCDEEAVIVEDVKMKYFVESRNDCARKGNDQERMNDSQNELPISVADQLNGLCISAKVFESLSALRLDFCSLNRSVQRELCLKK